jgi:hypothetical protein
MDRIAEYITLVRCVMWGSNSLSSIFVMCFAVFRSFGRVLLTFFLFDSNALSQLPQIC